MQERVETVSDTRHGWRAEKLARNVSRDARKKVALKDMRWKALAIWECVVRTNPEAVASEMALFLGPTVTME